MQTRYKILILLFIVTLAVGALALWHSSGDSDVVVRFRSLFFGSTAYDLKGNLASVLDRASLWYGGISLFALIMIVVACSAGRRDGPRTRERLIELKPAKVRTGSLLHGRSSYDSFTRHAKDGGLERRIRALGSELRDKGELLQSRDEELESLRSRLTTLAASSGEENELREEVERITEQLGAQASATSELENRLTATQELLQSRSQELSALKHEATSLTQQLADLRLAKEQAENILQQELGKTKSLQAKDSTITELEKRFAGQQQLLQSRNQELDALKSEVNRLRDQLADLTRAKEKAEDVLQQELKETKALQASIIAAQGNNLSEKVQALESELTEKQELLQNRSKELKATKSKVNSLRERLAAAESAKKQTETVLQQQLNKKTELLESKEAALKEIAENAGTRVDTFERELRNKEKLLGDRDAAVEALESEVNRLSESVSDRERAKSLLMQELKSRTELLQAKDAMVIELQERLHTTVQALENTQSDVEARERDLEGAVREQPSKSAPAGSRSDRKGMNSKLFELGAAKARAAASRQAEEAKHVAAEDDSARKEPREVSRRDQDQRGRKGS